MLSERPGCCFSSHLLPPSCTAYLSIPDWARKKRVSLAASCIAWEARCSFVYSHLSLWEKSWAWKVSFGRGTQEKWNYSSYPLQYVLYQISPPPPLACWNFSAGLLDLHKGTLIHGWLSESVFFGIKKVENSDIAILMISFFTTINFDFYVRATSVPQVVWHTQWWIPWEWRYCTSKDDVMDWIVSHPNSFFDALAPSVTIFGDGTFRKVIKVKWNHQGGLLIQ